MVRKKSKKLEKEIASPLKISIIWSKLVNPKFQMWVCLITLSSVISLLLFPNILSTRKEDFSLGDIVNRDIKSSQDFLVEDEELTKQRRDEAEKSSLFIYDFDRSGTYTKNRIRESFMYGRSGLEELLSIDLEPTLREEKFGELRDKFFEILGINEDSVLFDQLVKHNFSAEIEDNTITVVNRIMEKGVARDKTVLMTQKEKGIILLDIDTQRELTINDLDRFYDLESARKQVGDLIKQLIPNNNGSEIAEAIQRLAKAVIRPNVIFNTRETEFRKEEAKSSVKPIYFQVKKGEMIVREGEKITPTHLLKLETRAALKRSPPFPGMALSMAVIIGILLSLSYVVLLKRSNTFKGDLRSIIFLSSTLLFMFLATLLYNIVAEEVARGYHFFTIQVLLFALPISLGAILVSIFQGLDVAIAFSLIISILASLVVEGNVEFLIYFLLGSLMAAYGVRHCRERMVLIKTGMRVGLVNSIMALSIQSLNGNLYSPAGAISLFSAFLGGILAGVIATGFLSLIEIAFGFTTDIKLLELSSLDQPILRELMVKAPGTYHHSVIVSNMVEATAENIHANPLLAKVSAYYHDIGKIKKPLYFVENQMKGENRHEKLAPSMSSLILISHVKDGAELAKQHKLGKEIIDIIRQHQGTGLISYFYQKAKEQNKKRVGKSLPVKEEDFRYPGPKPQTKEAGLVLVADAAEAASRTLIDPTPARIQGMVQKIINNVFSDGQLDECELTLKDLNQIAKSFTKTLSGIFHSRIEYPEQITKGELEKKRENGNSNNIPVSHEKRGYKEDKNEAKEDLKRLGIS